MMSQEGSEEKSVSEDLRFALMMKECWKKEIEKAIENAKSKKPLQIWTNGLGGIGVWKTVGRKKQKTSDQCLGSANRGDER